MSRNPTTQQPPRSPSRPAYRKPAVKSTTLFVSLATCTPVCPDGCQCVGTNQCDCTGGG